MREHRIRVAHELLALERAHHHVAVRHNGAQPRVCLEGGGENMVGFVLLRHELEGAVRMDTHTNKQTWTCTQPPHLCRGQPELKDEAVHLVDE